MRFRHEPPPALRELRGRVQMPIGFAGGGASMEYLDDDPFPDLFLAGGNGGRLYRNVEGRRFEDVTEQSGLRLEGMSRAGYFVDVDNDGDQDLYVTFVGRDNRLFENRGGRFVDITDAVGLKSGRDVTHCAAWFDMDGDGLLDVATAAFGDWPAGRSPAMDGPSDNGQPNRLYRHDLVDGRRVFREIGLAAGVADNGWSQCVGVWDWDEDGRPDLVSLNDFSPSRFFRNLGGGVFEDWGPRLLADPIHSGMNFSLFDIDRDGRMELYVSEIDDDDAGSKLFQWRDGRLHDVWGERFEHRPLGWPWDASAFDYENDGDLDLLILNGTEDDVPGVDEDDEIHTYMRHYVPKFADMANVFYVNEGGFFYDASDRVPAAYEGNSRSAAVADIDQDGDLDVVINDYRAPARIYRNDQPWQRAWVRLRLEGTESNRDAVGARVTLRYGDEERVAVVVASTGFLSQDPKELHFGLGDWAGPVSARVRWPSGVDQEVEGLAPGRSHRIVEPGRRE